MAPKRPDPNTLLRHRQIIDAFKSDPKITDAMVADRFGISIPLITKIKQSEGLTNTTKRKREWPVVSPLAKAVGRLIHDHAKALPRCRPQPWDELSMTAQRYNLVIGGREFLSITQLERIAAWMNMPLSQLIKDAEALLHSCDARRINRSGPTGNSASSSEEAIHD